MSQYAQWLKELSDVIQWQSREKHKTVNALSKQLTVGKMQAFLALFDLRTVNFLLAACLFHSWTLKMEAVNPFETSVKLYWAERRHSSFRQKMVF
jgi:hypothetical protein